MGRKAVWFPVAVWAAQAAAQPAVPMSSWGSLGGGAARASVRAGSVAAFGTPRWVVHQTASGEPIEFIGHAGVAATSLPRPMVYSAGVVDGQTVAVGVDAEKGEVVWTAPLPAYLLDSWASPTIDEANGTVLYAAGTEVVALDGATGALAWRRAIGAPLVSVTPAVCDGPAHARRVFVTGYGGFGATSQLVCINAARRHEHLNPYDPGEIVWSTPAGSSAGGTVSVLNGTVYVAATGLDDDGHGRVFAFDARATEAPTPKWAFRNPIPEGFYGGVAVRETLGGTFVYAASYALYGSIDSANLVKVDAATGALVWSVASNRTDSIPVVLDDCRVVLSSGLVGFGSAPMIEMFTDHGAYAAKQWDTATATWSDANGNGVMDLGEFLVVGGWTTQPAALQSSGGARLLVGAIATQGDFFEAYRPLYELDLSRSPGEPGFIVQQTAAAGSTPGLLGAGVYSHGPGGLAAVGAPPPRADVNRDGRVDVDDLYAWEHGEGHRDVDGSGVVDGADRAILEYELRRNERRDLRKGRGR